MTCVLEIQRQFEAPSTTLGIMRFFDLNEGPPNMRESPMCETLEDGPSPDPYGRKVPGETRIPAGSYIVRLRTELGTRDQPTLFAKRKERWPAWHTHGMIHLIDVPGFEFIYIHDGRRHTHTKGCILVGYGRTMFPGEPGEILYSEAAYKNVYQAVTSKILAGREVIARISDF